MNKFQIIYIYIIIINLLSFMLYGIDKLKAKTNSYRIPERILILFTTLGGFIGSSLAMILFKHKLYKPKFINTAILASVLYLSFVGYFVFNL